MKIIKILAITSVCLAAPVTAQSAPTMLQRTETPDRGVFEGDWMTFGLGVGHAPSYEGSDDFVLFPAPIAQGSVSGFEFGVRGPGLYVDLVRDTSSGSDVKFVAGPLFRVRFDRNTSIKDPVVALLGKREVAVEVGATAGVSFVKVLNPYDQLTITVDGQWDVAGAHGGRLISPGVTYSTPLSRALFASINLSAIHADSDYADTYYSIDTAGSTASGLPVYQAGSGWKSYGASLLGGYDLSGNALDGGLSIFGFTSYSKLTGDARHSPVTSIRGDADQWFVAGGVSYTF